MIRENYIESVKKQFQYYKVLAEKSIEQIKDEDLFTIPNQNSNSIAIIVNHISGNMKSRWTDFMNSDGEKVWRNRDKEFQNIIESRDEMLKIWEEGWEILFATLNELTPFQMEQIIYIRNQGHTVIEAINRQLAHYSYHIGQIVLLAKLYCSDWKSLTIPKGKSEEYNKTKFGKSKHIEHFSDEQLKK